MVARSSKKSGTQFLKGLGSYRVPTGATSAAIESFLHSLDNPRALTVWLLWKHNEHKQLADLEFIPSHYDNHRSAGDAYAATCFLSKYKDLSLDYDKSQVALQKFEEFESLCKTTNSRFRNLLCDPLYKGHTVWLHHAVTRKIADILGDYSAEEVFSMCDWGPGASTLIRRRDASSVNKFQCETGITRDLFDLIPMKLLEEVYPLWSTHLISKGFPTFQTGNKVVTVPKNAKTDRVIAIEPGVNLWFQKSLGDMIGRRLLRRGIDLRYQIHNQRLARSGSKSDHLATVDMSSASDSISLEVVRELLPPRWFSLLDSCRSHFGVQSGTQRKWEKFSSMGNGFTFQLESLIFYAVALCCAEFQQVEGRFNYSQVSVYGDDVIIPSSSFELFSEMVAFYGFRINYSKSFHCSPFRESCGAHFFSGFDIKPVYLKDRLSSVLAIYRLANAVRRLSHRRCASMACDSSFRATFELLVHLVPVGLRLRIPETLGDGGFISNFDESTPSRHSSSKLFVEGYLVPNVVEVSKTYQDDRLGYLLASLWSLSKRQVIDSRHDPAEDRTMLEAIDNLTLEMSSLERNSVPRKMDLKVKLSKSVVQQWYDLGPWV